ncbi:Uu.00g141070.m01.CDS01 [Anthostomella pinea]|uniref:Uu.00g141070.m01.CDS01 n=1 Tax=Anthostomella pinea TaxID=933095 RepID=A0AAI8VQA8_9PEZI|nr:Uu.00g141070.m01.CDS01 [Anthostomella pinea]
MEGPPEKRRLLFLHADTHSPTKITQRRTRNRSLDTKVRRHLMVAIGKSRRKPSKAPPSGTFEWSLADISGAVSSTGRTEHLTSRDEDHLQVPARKDLVVSETAAQYTALYATPPILDALSVFEKEWGEDSFSAYGFTLIMIAGRNAMSSTFSTNTFWFPFAFRKSPFLHHYQQIFTSPNVLIPLYRRSARALRSLALERSLETIQCVESRLSSSDAGSATSDSVIHAVLALVCYNFTSLDFDQAMTHVKGMRMVVTARGGISTLEANQDLMLMISWVDITAALLHDTKPLFPLPPPMASASADVFRGSGLDALPAPLLRIINDENTQNARFMNVVSCIGDLNGLAAHLRFELATKGGAIWANEEQMGFLLNPVTHQLLNLNQAVVGSEPVTRWDIISEALRLGAIIWIIRVKRRCRSYPGTAAARISTLLQILARQSDAVPELVWSGPDLCDIRLWLLVLCGISEPDDEDSVIAMEMIASKMLTRKPGSLSWEYGLADIRQMPWVDIFEPSCAVLGQRLLRDHLGAPGDFGSGVAGW